MSRTALYWSVNVAFVVLVAMGLTVGGFGNGRPLYLILLFALCSTPIFNATGFNDRYALLVLFSAIYFQYFGVIDLLSLFTGAVNQSGILSIPEVVILVGGCLTQIGYRLACRKSLDRSVVQLKDWPETTLIVMGVLIWTIATWFSWQFKVHIITAATAQATARGLASLSGLQTMGYLLAVMIQPLGIMVIAYAQCRYRRSYLFPLLILIVLVQLVMGFVADAKGEALIGGVLIVIVRLMTTGKIPKGWLIAAITIIAVVFPVLQANRNLRGQYRIDHVEAAQNLLETVKQAMSKGEEVKSGRIKAQNVFERSSLKGSVEMIVTRTGADVAYQNGHTLTPLYAAFIPKIIWPDKPDVQTGLLVNTEFKVVPGAFVYISPSHLGELYWNFGWPGVTVGMLLVGCLLGYVGKRVDMTQGATITQLMIAVVTVKLLVLGFESAIAGIYVSWLRTLAAIGLLHFLLARPIAASFASSDRALESTKDVGKADIDVSLPNLLR